MIVGGGGAGLTSSTLLSTYGAKSLLVSALPTTSTYFATHLGQRILRLRQTREVICKRKAMPECPEPQPSPP